MSIDRNTRDEGMRMEDVGENVEEELLKNRVRMLEKNMEKGEKEKRKKIL